MNVMKKKTSRSNRSHQLLNGWQSTPARKTKGVIVTWNRCFEAGSEQWHIGWYCKMTNLSGENWRNQGEEWTGRGRGAASFDPSMVGCLRCSQKTIHPHEASKKIEQSLNGRYHNRKLSADRVLLGWYTDEGPYTWITVLFCIKSLLFYMLRACCCRFCTNLRWLWTPTTIPPLRSQQCWFDPSRAPPWLLLQHYRFAF